MHTCDAFPTGEVLNTSPDQPKLFRQNCPDGGLPLAKVIKVLRSRSLVQPVHRF
jgi:hypothetical protein